MEMGTRYDHQVFDQEIKNFWDQNGVYAYTPDRTKKVFSIDTPPPTVSGTLHIGHVFSYTHTDLIARYKRMQGFNVFYPMGYDDNGLATERFVEKKNNIKAQFLKRSDFIDLCLKNCAEAEKDFEALWKTLGLSIDWSKTYSTIGTDARIASQKSFLKLLQAKKIYRKQEPALYCTTCQTSLAQADLDSAEFASTFNNVVFKMESSGQELTIATTRPELLPACVAIMYHPNDARYAHLKDAFAITPIYGKRVPCIPDEKVDPEKGTGIVTCSTFGDTTDIYWFKTYNLPFIQVVGRDGKWTEVTGPLQGLKVHEARKRILELLAESGELREQLAIKHDVRVHERCKQEIEYLILTQWFVDILNHKQEFLDQADKINWHPSFMQTRYVDWVKHLNWDWCISRQRFYGIPFPVWHCNACNEVLLAPETSLPIDPQEQPFPGGTCKCGSSDLRPDTDVMDTWNTSSITPQLVTRWELGERPTEMPMSMRPQAHDIIRTWAFYTIIKAYYHNNDIPWRDIVISGHVLAGKEKISKSKGNEKITPISLLEQFSPDVIRFWTASGAPGADTAFSENQLKIGQKLVTKLWNAMRFSAEFLQNFKPAQKPATLGLTNEWIHDEFAHLVAGYCEHFDTYDYNKSLELVEKFFWHDFCDNYLELIKDQIFNPTKYAAADLDATRYVLYTISYGLLQLYAPFIPFVTEKLYQLLFRGHVNNASLHTTKLDRREYKAEYPHSIKLMHTMLGVVAQVRKLKSEHQLSLKTPLIELVIHSGDAHVQAALQGQQAVLTGITQAAKVSFVAATLDEEKLDGHAENYTAHVKA